jgi:hypothetical protein
LASGGALLTDLQYSTVRKIPVYSPKNAYIFVQVIKFFATISTIIYFAVTSGIIVNVHYCMNEFDSAQLYQTSTDVCNKCGMHTDDSNGCCHDDLKVIKLNEDHLFSQFNFELKSPEVSTIQYSNLFADLNIEKVLGKDYQNHSPPLLSGQDICIQNCVFRI